MTQLQAKVRALAKGHPIPSDDKLERRLFRLERMMGFYETKIPEAPENQAKMFKSFVNALLYATTMIKMYRKITKHLAELAEVSDDES